MIKWYDNIEKNLAYRLDNRVPERTFILEELLEEPAEIELAHKIVLLEDQLLPLMYEKKYEEVLRLTCELTEPLTKFMDNVRMNVDDEDIKNNRFRLIRRAQYLITLVVCDDGWEHLQNEIAALKNLKKSK